jgi:glutamate--cysteine ligase
MASLPSARVLAEVQGGHDGSYTRFIRTQSQAAKRELLALPFDDALAERFAAEARVSQEAQCRAEAEDTMPFEDFRAQYLAEERLNVA